MIKIIDDWVIDSDGMQYIGGKYATRLNKKKKEVEEYVKDPFYCSTFSDCLSIILRRMRAKAVANINGSINDAYIAIKREDERMLNAIRGAFGDVEIFVNEPQEEANAGNTIDQP